MYAIPLYVSEETHDRIIAFVYAVDKHISHPAFLSRVPDRGLDGRAA